MDIIRYHEYNKYNIKAYILKLNGYSMMRVRRLMFNCHELKSTYPHNLNIGLIASVLITHHVTICTRYFCLAFVCKYVPSIYAHIPARTIVSQWYYKGLWNLFQTQCSPWYLLRDEIYFKALWWKPKNADCSYNAIVIWRTTLCYRSLTVWLHLFYCRHKSPDST